MQEATRTNCLHSSNTKAHTVGLMQESAALVDKMSATRQWNVVTPVNLAHNAEEQYQLTKISCKFDLQTCIPGLMGGLMGKSIERYKA